MRLMLTFLMFLLFAGLYAQVDTNMVAYSAAVEQSEEGTWAPLQATSHWLETSSGSRSGYVLSLDVYESFTEDAGISPNRKYQYLRGRWILDTTANQLTLAVDGLMGGSSLSSRYLRGRDYYLDYDITVLTTDTLELKDQLTGEVRTFQRTEAAPYQDPMLNQPVKLELPGMKGGVKFPGGGW